MRQIRNKNKNAYDSPLNVKDRDIIQTLDDFLLHLVNCLHMPCFAEMELCCSLVLFDKIQLTMIFWIEIAKMAMQLDQLLKLGLLRHEIGL